MSVTPHIQGIVTRSQWGAAPAKRAASKLVTPAVGVGVHHGASATPTDHAKCALTWRSYQRYHLAHPTENYSDIAYCVGFCTHGYVFIGRGDGWTTQGGANGTSDANRRYYSACFIGTGTSGFGTAAKAALLWILREFRIRGKAGLAVKPHRWFVPGRTSCPSDPIAAFIAAYDGKPIDARPTVPTKPPPPPPLPPRSWFDMATKEDLRAVVQEEINRALADANVWRKAFTGMRFFKDPTTPNRGESPDEPRIPLGQLLELAAGAAIDATDAQAVRDAFAEAIEANLAVTVTAEPTKEA